MPNTNKRLIVLRHASAGRGASDHERTLDAGGLESVAPVGRHLASLGWRPQRVLSSDATRTRQTWAQIADPLRLDAEAAVEFRRELYLADPSRITTTLATVPDDIETIMLVGHNPGLEELLDDLCRVRVRMMPCNAALLEIEADDWATACGRGDWTLDTVLRPGEL